MKGSKLLITTTTIATCFCYYYINKTVYDNSLIELKHIYSEERQMDKRAYNLQKVKVLNVIEGDIIEVDNNGIREKIRLIGIDCPNIGSYENTNLSMFKDEDYYLTNEELLTKYNLKEEDIPLDLKTSNIAAYIKEQILEEKYNPPEEVLKESNKDKFNIGKTSKEELSYNSNLTNEQKELLKIFYNLKSGNMADEAKQYTSDLLLDKEIYILDDIQSLSKDSLNRSLKYAFFNEPKLEENEESIKKNLINYNIVMNGYAKATNFGLPKQYSKELKFAEQIAKKNKSGIWDIDKYYENLNKSILKKEGKKDKEINNILNQYKKYLDGTFFEDNNTNNKQ